MNETLLICRYLFIYWSVVTCSLLLDVFFFFFFFFGELLLLFLNILYHNSSRHLSVGLAIDYFSQRVYWADAELSVIGSVRFDGSDPLVVIDGKQGEKNSWKGIWSYIPEIVALNGFKRFDLSNLLASLHACTGISQPYRIDIFEDYIYGTGLKNEVFRIHKYGKKNIEPLNLGIEKTTNVLISHRFKQQDGKRTYFL